MLVGRLTADPELRYTQSGTASASFSLAVTRRFANQNGEREADFINCVAWQKGAEFVANYFKKGQWMELEGRMQVRSYEKDGQKRWVTEVVADQIGFVGYKPQGAPAKEKSSNVVVGLGEEIVFNDGDLPF